jgi:hypothetical protein
MQKRKNILVILLTKEQFGEILKKKYMLMIIQVGLPV